jgi:3-isopropylmalate/(R)-2-methylmalate dehydratase small subunit
VIRGKVAWVFGNNFDVDFIVGIENISTTDIDRIVANLMRSYDENFRQSIASGDILIGGKNFGYGHPHPQSMMGMRAIGIDCIIAESYAFPFYRSELASGMKLFECPGIAGAVERGACIEIDQQALTVFNKTSGKELRMKAIPDIPLRIMEKGGLLPFLKAEMRYPAAKVPI